MATRFIQDILLLLYTTTNSRSILNICLYASELRYQCMIEKYNEIEYILCS